MHEFRDPESSIVTFVWYRPVPPSKATTAPHCSPGSVFDTCCAHMAAGEGTTLAEKSIHHRPLRDTTASTSLRRVLTSPPSVDGQATRAELTMRYAQAGIDMNRQALEQVFPDVMSSAKDQTIIALMAGCLAGCTACRRSVMWSCIAGSRASWAFAVSAPHLSAVHVVTVEEPFVQSSSWHGKGCPYCGRLALAELVRNPAPDQA